MNSVLNARFLVLLSLTTSILVSPLQAQELPENITAAASEAMQSYVDRHLPPDPSSFLEYTCTQQGDAFCQMQKNAWNSYLQSYDASAVSNNVYYGNQNAANNANNSDNDKNGSGFLFGY